LAGDLEKLLASGDICSKRWIWEQYDFQVPHQHVGGAGRGCCDSAVERDRRVAGYGSRWNSRYCYLSPREGTRLIVAECCRNLAVAGADPVGATNNLNFGNPERPEVMAQLVESIGRNGRGLPSFRRSYHRRNVSLYNETLGEGIWPTPVIGVVGLIKTAAPVTIPFKTPDREICSPVAGALRPEAVRRHAVRESHLETALGHAAGARSGL